MAILLLKQHRLRLKQLEHAGDFIRFGDGRADCDPVAALVEFAKIIS
jgi:hypothetical protein